MITLEDYKRRWSPEIPSSPELMPCKAEAYDLMSCVETQLTISVNVPLLVVLGTEPGALCLPGKCSTLSCILPSHEA